MLFRLSIVAWFTLTVILALEYYALNFSPSLSMLRYMQHSFGYLKELSLSPDPGRPLSMFLGYTGLGIMLIMNLYSMRKRFALLGSLLPNIKRMLDFHIFCGLMGPTLILFHSNFKVRGLVAISFWSMLVSAGSGVIGRYFYTQIARSEKDLSSEIEKLGTDIKDYFSKKLPKIDFSQVLNSYLRSAGFHSETANVENMGALAAFYSSAAADIRLLMLRPQFGVPERAHFALVKYASLKRQEGFIGQFRKLMGYWHAFHLPFAFFMYLAAIFHVAAALLLGVAKK